VMIYYAGHGQLDNFEGISFWIPVDATDDPTTWLASDRIRRAVAHMKARHVLLISDSCFAGDFFRERKALPIIDEAYYRRAYARRSRQAMTSGGVEPVADAALEGPRPFAYWLIDALKRNTKPYLSPSELFDEIKLLTGLEVRPVLAPRDEIDKVIKEHYGVGGDTVEEMTGGEDLSLTSSEDDNQDLLQMAQEASVIKLVNEIILEAINERASDIHIEPFERTLSIRYRIDGVLHETFIFDRTPPSPATLNKL